MKEKIETILLLGAILFGLILSISLCNMLGILGWIFSFVFAAIACMEKHERMKRRSNDRAPG